MQNSMTVCVRNVQKGSILVIEDYVLNSIHYARPVVIKMVLVLLAIQDILLFLEIV